MSRTSYYVSKFDGEPTETQTSVMFNDDLFGSVSARNIDPIQNAKHQAILKWLQECSSTTPEITQGINDSIVSWFLQSAYLLPSALGLKVEKQPTEVSEAIRILVKNKCLSKETILSLKESIDDTPLPNVIWQILSDVHRFAVNKYSVTVPLTRTLGNRPIIFQRETINKFLTRLKLPLLPSIEEAKRPIVDDPFKNGTFYTDLYITLTNEKIMRIKPTRSVKQAKLNIESGINLLIKGHFLDESFSICSSAVVNGDMLLIQQIISCVICNSSSQNNEKSKLIDQEDFPSSPIQRGKQSPEKVFIRSNKIQDGLALVKLLTCIDPEFDKVECLFAIPSNDVEKKWNVKKAIEFLLRKDKWPIGCTVDSSLIYAGELNSTKLLFKGLTECYNNKFVSLSSILNLKEILGLDTTKI
ncbi:hypothetical protein TRFO_20041 [Tritrichomonas foetus]|uniref:Uncharacterized protein n=1 Tax=Tritrichomonas foetus TaxID=1144522 RepID=A0A1J4KMG2_9EUKA|nr:hypothetical protein TRFO_20041 [Tritrichomonas foetus]|eukprot:OHT10557.1 hypothetical protein TRFO_20041 [Tritrichomonas foetus]